MEQHEGLEHFFEVMREAAQLYSNTKCEKQESGTKQKRECRAGIMREIKVEQTLGFELVKDSVQSTANYCLQGLSELLF